jgi:uncharacterized membrane protein YeaQ/YmgE (transglycosylase-associated protein family)
MSILAFLLFGFVIGLLARALMPGQQKMGILLTTVLGVVGSFAGGFIGSLFAKRSVLELSTSGFIGSLAGAMLILAIFAYATRRRRLAA